MVSKFVLNHIIRSHMRIGHDESVPVRVSADVFGTHLRSLRITKYGSTGMVPSIIDVWGYDREFCSSSSSSSPPPSGVTQKPNNIK